jgi:hypothetical protein
MSRSNKLAAEKKINEEKRRVWNMNYRRWVERDPNFAATNELCYSYVFDGLPGGWFLKKIERDRYNPWEYCLRN